MNSTQLTTVNTGYFKLDGGAMFGVVPKVIWNKLNPSDEHNLCNWAMRSLLIRTEDRLILVDNGMGDKQDEKFMSHYYLNGDDSLDKSLAAAGVSHDDITDVILTHLHFDHCGGSINQENGKLVPAFKNALYWSNERHWNWAIHPNAREKASFLKENILPIQESGKLRFVEKHTNEFPAGIIIRQVFGHTEAMMLPQVQYKGRTVLFMADLVPSAAHIPMPYVMAYDMFPLTTLNEKMSFLTEAVENDYVLYFQHDPVNECCTLQKTDRGIRVKETFKLSEL